ncbi:superoxide dismutase family protein [Brevundimonas balnearis]|uniref:Superoxide dismutase family protein n=1 Tax=Brevundimonas balnearis TaxID=1572858 RepID=A0ABV6R3U7_9CAUL
MRRTLSTAIAVTAFALAVPACASVQEASAPQPVAVAQLRTAEGGDAGSVTAYRGPLGLLLRVEGRGWPAGWHGVHLHATGVCEGPGFTSAGGHVDHPTTDRAHGLLNMDGGPELGDLQNVYAAADGTAMAEVYAAGPQLTERGHDLLDADGLAFIVHANPDDHVSQPIGGAGARIACGVFEAR